MTDIVLVPIASGYNLSKINDNFVKVQDAINNDVLHTSGGANTMSQDLDLNGHDLLNANIDPTNPNALLTVGVGDARYYNVDGDTLTGPMQVNGQVITGLTAPVNASDAVRKTDLDYETGARVGGDNSLQAQINGVNPPMASAFSVISWHDQAVTNSITIPPNKNAWSFGPSLTISPGQVVTISAGSFWTVANGAVYP